MKQKRSLKARNIFKEVKGRVCLSEPLSELTTFRIGGPARFFIEPQDISALKSAISLSKKNKIPLLMIGSGSNILAPDKGVGALVLRLTRPNFTKIKIRGNSVEAGAGVPLVKLLHSVRKRGLSGIEFLAGIPGTVGGALVMNAGIPGKNIADSVADVTVMDYNNNIRKLKKRQIRFGYRESSLSGQIVLGATFKLDRQDSKLIKKSTDDYLRYRCLSQGAYGNCAGCVFKNPAGHSAGKLIDICGLKGERVGGAYISTKHANFILSSGKAKAGDVLKLMNIVKKKVKKRFGIILEPEIKIWRNSGLSTKK